MNIITNITFDSEWFKKFLKMENKEKFNWKINIKILTCIYESYNAI